MSWRVVVARHYLVGAHRLPETSEIHDAVDDS
ncbi:MAG: hypothetical protein ACI9TF_002021, partial [Paracrocinitomix sp.]